MPSESSVNHRSSWQAEGSLALLALIWGSSHVVTKDILATHSPSFYTSARFGLASVLFLIIFWRHLRLSTRAEVRQGVLLGLCSFAGIAFYVSGLLFTQVSKAGFISGLHLVFTPIVAFAIFRVRPKPEHLAGLVVAVVGFLAMSLPGSSPMAGEGLLNIGDLLVLMAAVAWAVHIAATTAFAIRGGVRTLAVVQVITVALLAILVHLALRLAGLERSLNPIDAGFLWRIGYISLVVTCIAALIQTGGQKRVSPTHAAVLYTLEPVSSAIFAYIILGEELGTRRWIGAAMILLGVTISRLGLPRLINRSGGADSGVKH